MSEDQVVIASPDGYRPVHGTLNADAKRAGRLVLLFHGIFVDRSENGRYDRLAPELAAAGFDSLRVDLAGHGASETPSIETHLSRMCTEILDTLEWAASRYQHVSVVASSFAGALVPLAFRTPATAPKLQHLIFLNPVLDFDNAFIHAALPEMAEIFSSANQKQAFEQGSFNPTPGFTMSREFLLELILTDVASAYLALSTRHLVIHGTADELISFEHNRAIVEKNAAATFEAVDGGVHAFTQSGHEPRIRERIISWLSSA